MKRADAFRAHYRNRRRHGKSRTLTQVISAGKNNMPAFGNRLDKDQIQKLADYIHTLHGDSAAQ